MDAGTACKPRGCNLICGACHFVHLLDGRLWFETLRIVFRLNTGMERSSESVLRRCIMDGSG